jgi:hypothetical protein
MALDRSNCSPQKATACHARYDGRPAWGSLPALALHVYCGTSCSRCSASAVMVAGMLEVGGSSVISLALGARGTRDRVECHKPEIGKAHGCRRQLRQPLDRRRPGRKGSQPCSRSDILIIPSPPERIPLRAHHSAAQSIAGDRDLDRLCCSEAAKLELEVVPAVRSLRTYAAWRGKGDVCRDGFDFSAFSPLPWKPADFSNFWISRRRGSVQRAGRAPERSLPATHGPRLFAFAALAAPVDGVARVICHGPGAVETLNGDPAVSHFDADLHRVASQARGNGLRAV